VTREHDVLVVGAGVGGLVAGALCARRGLRTLVLEQGPGPGGLCGAAQRGAYVFDHGPGAFWGTPAWGVVPRIFAELGAALPAEPLCPALQVCLPKHRLTLSPDRATLRRELRREYGPDGDEALAALERLAALDAEAGPLGLYTGGPPVRLARLLRRAPRQLRLWTRARRWARPGSLARLVPDSSPDGPARGLLEPLLLGLGGLEFAEASALIGGRIAAAVLAGLWTVPGGSQGLAELLAQSGGAHGWALRCDTPVRALALEGRRAAGVITEAGETLTAWAVVLNGTPAALGQGLLADFRERRRWRRSLGRPRGRFAPLALLIGLDADYVPSALGERALLVPDGDPAGRIVGPIVIAASRPGDGRRAPPGKRALTATALLPAATGAAGLDGARERAVEAAADFVLESLRAFLPGAARAIEALEVVPPAQFEAWTRRPDGELGHGPAQPGSLAGWGAGMATPVRNLWLVGDWVAPGLGVEGAALAGLAVANRLAPPARAGPAG
jgi:phytoene dehydrogenase-like protein